MYSDLDEAYVFNERQDCRVLSFVKYVPMNVKVGFHCVFLPTNIFTNIYQNFYAVYFLSSKSPSPAQNRG
jgi:hypothetical protein